MQTDLNAKTQRCRGARGEPVFTSDPLRGAPGVLLMAKRWQVRTMGFIKSFKLRSSLTWLAVIACLAPGLLAAADQLQWGHGFSRNMVSEERNLPASLDPETGKNLKWKARLGSETHATPVIASGKVLIRTNNEEPRHPRRQAHR